jgi:hypothetical protein
MGACNAAYSAATFRFVFIMCAALLPLLFVDRVFRSVGTLFGGSCGL